MGTNATGLRKQIDNMQALGFDGYNGALTGDKAATLGVNCGMTTGRNGVLVKNAIGVDLYNQNLTGGVSKTLNSIATDSDHIPCILIKKEQPIYTLKIRGGVSRRRQGSIDSER
jgi:DNA (cytosine-5)-methyltransferase 1